MPVKTIPLINSMTTRGPWGQDAINAYLAGKDAKLVNCVPSVVSNKELQNSTVYIQKRLGVALTTSLGTATGATAIFSSPSTAVRITAWGDTTSAIYADTTSVGSASGQVFAFIETIISSVTFWLMVSSDGTGWFLASDSYQDTSFTGDTHTNTTIDNISGASGLYVGQLISGTGIQAGTRIASIVSATSITTTLATTASNSGITITKTPLAKIIDPDFPASIVGQFAELDGYVFVMTSNSRIYNSDINSVTSWQPQNFITANAYTDGGAGVIKYKNKILGFGETSIEQFYNAGNSSGSILSRINEATVRIGVTAYSNWSNIVNCGDNVFFMGTSDGGTGAVYLFNDNGIKRISNQTIESILSYYSASVSFSSFGAYGCTILNFGLINQTISFLYFLELDEWLPWITRQPLKYSGVANNIYCVETAGTQGEIYVIAATSNVYRDDSTAYSMIIQTEPYSLNKGLPFQIDNISLIADTQSSGSTLLESTADDYATFGTIGSFSLTDQQKNLAGGGYYDTSVAFRLTDSGNNPWRGQALQITWRPCL